MLLVLTACTSESKEKYTVEKAKSNGDLVIQHEASSFQQIRNGAVEVSNLQSFASFQKSFNEKDENQLTIAYFDPHGDVSKSTLKTSGGEVTYINNFTGYPQLAKTTYTCKFLSVRNGTGLVEYCETSEGKSVSNALLFIVDKEKVREAGIEEQ